MIWHCRHQDNRTILRTSNDAASGLRVLPEGQIRMPASSTRNARQKALRSPPSTPQEPLRHSPLDRAVTPPDPCRTLHHCSPELARVVRA